MSHDHQGCLEHGGAAALAIRSKASNLSFQQEISVPNERLQRRLSCVWHARRSTACFSVHRFSLHVLHAVLTSSSSVQISEDGRQSQEDQLLQFRCSITHFAQEETECPGDCHEKVSTTTNFGAVFFGCFDMTLACIA